VPLTQWKMLDTDQISPLEFSESYSARRVSGINLFRVLALHVEAQSTKRGFVPKNDSTYSGKILVRGRNFGFGIEPRACRCGALSSDLMGFERLYLSFFALIFFVKE